MVPSISAFTVGHRGFFSTYHVNPLGVSPEIAAPLACGDGGAQMIVVVLVQRVERLRVGIANEVIQVLRLPETGMLRTGGRVMVRGEGRREVRGLKVGGGRQRGAPVMGHAAPVPVSPMSMVMGTGIGRRVAAAQRGNAPMTRQAVLRKHKRHTESLHCNVLRHCFTSIVVLD